MYVFRQQESIESNQTRDEIKAALSSTKGITLIEVPYWWDRKLSSLAATVYNTRPDLFTEQPKGKPIPLIPPANEKHVSVTGINSINCSI